MPLRTSQPPANQPPANQPPAIAPADQPPVAQPPVAQPPVALPPVALPSPQDLPKADIMIYDGNCKFCRKSVTRIYRLDGRGRIAFISLHDPFVAETFPDLTHEDLMAQMYVVDRQGRRHGGPEAFKYLSRRLPKLWPLAVILHIPFSMPLWQAIYRWIAKRRYLFGGARCEDGTCHIG